nr:putative carbohydrate binding domain containing protein [uncultured Mediterranean phage uvMED]
MSYIGRKPTVGNFQICDAISVVNGQAAYTMQVGSVNVLPETANHMIVSLNGTIQKPNSSFTVSGSTITFSSNLATGDVIDFIQILGDVLDLGVPSDATVTTAKLASDSVTYEKIGYNANQFRNIIINGDMSIAQRGTSVTGLQNSGGIYLIDRFSYRRDGTWSSAQFTMTQSTDVPTGQGFATSLKMDCTTAEGSPPSNVYASINQKFEGQNLQYLKKGTSSAESTTLSFWVKSNKTGTYIAEIDDDTNSRNINKSYTISSANTWEKKTITFAGDTSGTLNNTNAESLNVNFFLGAGSNFTSGTLATSWESTTNANRAVGQVNLADSTSNEWYITGVQLEAGTTASDFEFLPVDVNLQRCQRYFYKLIDVPGGDAGGYFTSGFMYSSSILYSWNEFPTMMRAAPTLSVASGTDYYIFYRASAGDNLDDFDLTIGRPNGAMIRNNADVSGTGGEAGGIHSTSNSKVTFSAEL